MKISEKIIAAAAAAAVCLSAASPAYAAVNTDIPITAAVYDDDGSSSFSLTFNDEAPRFATVDEAADYVKSCIKQHNEDFDLIVTGWEPVSDEDDITKEITEKYSVLTDDPTEGIYMSLNANITGGWSICSEGAYAKYAVDYYTTAEEEAELTAAIASLKETPEFIAAKASDAYDKVLWAYDQVIANMKLNDNLANSAYSTAYSALIKKDANESGQMHLMVRLLQEFGLQPMIYMTNLKSLSADSVDCHVLGFVMIDGLYYFIDPVWDYKMGENKHRFFLKGYTDLDSESDGSEEFTHIHLFQLFNIPVEDAMKESQVSGTAYVRPAQKEYSDGDVNGDGEINAVDASVTLQEYALLSGEGAAGSFTEAQAKAADIDGNGMVDAVDASRILAYYAYISTLDGEEIPQNIKEYQSV